MGYAEHNRPHFWWSLILAGLLLMAWGCQLGGGREAAELARSLPIYPGARFLAEFSTYPPDDVSSAGITYESDDQAGQVFEFYMSVLPTEGWALVGSVEDPQPGVPWQLHCERRGWWCRVVIEEGLPTQIRLRVGRQ